MVVLCMYSVRTSMSEYIQGVRIPEVSCDIIYDIIQRKVKFQMDEIPIMITGTGMIQVLTSTSSFQDIRVRIPGQMPAIHAATQAATRDDRALGTGRDSASESRVRTVTVSPAPGPESSESSPSPGPTHSGRLPPGPIPASLPVTVTVTAAALPGRGPLSRARRRARRCGCQAAFRVKFKFTGIDRRAVRYGATR
jgi:hypothetical protein